MELQKLKNIRTGNKRAITRLLGKLEDFKSNDDFIGINTALTLVQEKKANIQKIDEQILTLIEEDDIADEFENSDKYIFEVDCEIAEILEYIEHHAQNEILNVNAQNFVPRINTNLSGHQLSSSSSVSSQFHKLPKLSLPIFDGDILQWKTFWESFQSTIQIQYLFDRHSKILKAQLHGQASQCIEGLPITNNSYLQAIDILLKRFGQTHKVTNAYMEHLINIPAPRFSASSLRSFHDKMESYIRGLESLGQCEESFGSLLIPIIKNKLPPNCRKCGKRHHTSICNDHIPQSPNPKVYVSEGNKGADKEEKTAALHSTTITSHSEVLLKTAIAPVWSEFQHATASILLDEGAQNSFMSEDLAKELNIETTGTTNMKIAAFGGSESQIRHLKTARIYIESVSGERIPIEVVILPKIAAPIEMKARINAAKLPYLRGLQLAHPVTHHEKFNINLLIGADYYWSIVQDKVIRGSGPTAVKSKLGYLLSGPIITHKNSTTVASSMGFMNTAIMNILINHKSEEVDLEKFWKIESLGVKDTLDNSTSSTSYMEEYQNTSISFNNDRYTAKLPWREDHQELPTNEFVTRNRTINVVKRIAREPNLLKMYGDIIFDQEKRGFIEKVSDDNIKSGDKIHYIPHHPVKNDSTTTPIRIVYDCSCHQDSESPSLNDCLLSTPPKLNDITGLIARFRVKKYGISTDIEKAFLNVNLDEGDRDVTRFFWLRDPSDPNSPLITYRFKAVLFGAMCSPFILNATLLKHLNGSQTELSNDLQRNLYVDNILSSVNTEQKALHYFRGSRDLLRQAGFNLRSWSSYSKDLRKAAENENVHDTDNVVKILGMRWNPVSDTIAFAEKARADIGNLLATKREVLKQSASIYDPLGILGPVTIRAKLLMQRLWKDGLSWDEKLSEKVKTSWIDILVDTALVTAKTSIPRKYFVDSDNTIKDSTLHVFVDASQKAYGACAYIVNHTEASFVMAKNRVAPIKGMTLPQLELMAAVLGARLGRHLLDELELERVVYWSDSQIVIHWLSSEKQQNKFIKNRRKEINDLTGSKHWRYVPAHSNPADLQTRGISAKEI
ncbi:uncharacterized protein [Argopecten irradians]|uniref:uncharacterized protein n=1 Tax=Argopecten irradians TaxID=31199 RepID=UPI003712E858